MKLRLIYRYDLFEGLVSLILLSLQKNRWCSESFVFVLSSKVRGCPTYVQFLEQHVFCDTFLHRRSFLYFFSWGGATMRITMFAKGDEKWVENCVHSQGSEFYDTALQKFIPPELQDILLLRLLRSIQKIVVCFAINFSI